MITRYEVEWRKWNHKYVIDVACDGKARNLFPYLPPLIASRLRFISGGLFQQSLRSSRRRERARAAAG